jgi:hypothetical protein
MKQNIKLPALDLTLPDLEIPIVNHKGKKIGVAAQVKIKGRNIEFKPKLKGWYSRNNFDFAFEYSPYIEDQKINKIELKAIQRF